MKEKILACALVAAVLATGAAPAAAQVCTPSHECGDVNGSDDVTVADALGVLRRAIGLTVNMQCSCDGGGECPMGGVVRTQQTECWDPLDISVPITAVNCAGTGQDGELQRGLTPIFVDNGDGTVSDKRTTLMWEKLSNDNSIHDYDNVSFQWQGAFQKVNALNADSFAGYTDWRVPQIRELESLAAYNNSTPATWAIFNDSCIQGCSIFTCSCTLAGEYWSSTTNKVNPQNAWRFDARTGESSLSATKTIYKYVRAVRGGY